MMLLCSLGCLIFKNESQIMRRRVFFEKSPATPLLPYIRQDISRRKTSFSLSLGFQILNYFSTTGYLKNNIRSAMAASHTIEITNLQKLHHFHGLRLVRFQIH